MEAYGPGFASKLVEVGVGQVHLLWSYKCGAWYAIPTQYAHLV
jgi:hypothetical protein